MDTQKKGIGKGELIALIVSSCIGTGIFGITSDVAAAAAPGPALLAWLFVAFGFLMLVLSLNNLTYKVGSLPMLGKVSVRWVNLFLAGPTGCQLGWVTLPLLRC